MEYNNKCQMHLSEGNPTALKARKIMKGVAKKRLEETHSC